MNGESVGSLDRGMADVDATGMSTWIVDTFVDLKSGCWGSVVHQYPVPLVPGSIRSFADV
jgi:hypothetical protein